MKTRIRANNITGHLNMVSSKSLLHRYLILSTKSKNTKIYTNKISVDVKTTIDCLKELGTNIEISTIEQCESTFNKVIDVSTSSALNPKVLDMNESGASFRFLLPYTFLEGREVEFRGHGRLPERPIDELVEVLKKNSIKFTKNRLPFKASGKLEGSHFIFSGETSSQYISAIMLSSSLMEQETIIDITGEMVSKSYILMTANCMRDFGVRVNIDRGFKKIVIDGRDYKAPSQIYIESDWSNAILPIAAGILGGGVTIGGLFKKSYQGDAKTVEVLRKLGANVEYNDNELLVHPSEIKGFDLDIDDNIDLFPVLSILAIKAKGKSVFRNIDRLRYKESNRIDAVLEIHKAIGSKAYIEDDRFIVEPSQIKSAKLRSHNDHRIVMASVLVAMICEEVQIEGFEAIEKSYPNFIEDMESIGFNIEEIS